MKGKIGVRLVVSWLAVLVWACVAQAATQTVKDSIGREVEIPDPVTRAVVANAYNTEIINAIGALDRVVGVDYNIYQDKESWRNSFSENQVIGKS